MMTSVQYGKVREQQVTAIEPKGKEGLNVEDLCDSVLKELLLFGLTPNEGKIFIHLSRSGPSRAGQISKNLGIHRTEIYHLLTSLQNKGLVRSIFDHPFRFAAIEFEKGLDTLIEYQRQTLTSIEAKRGELISLWNKVPKEGLDDDDDSSFQVIKGLDQIYRKAAEMGKNAEKSMVISGSEIDLTRVDQSCLFETIGKEHRRGVRVVTHPWSSSIEVPDWVKKCTRHILNRETVIPHVFIVDEKQLLFVMNDGKSSRKEVTAMWNDSPAFVYAFISSFEQLWISSRSD